MTRVESNILYEIDGTPALTVYKNYLGELCFEKTVSILHPEIELIKQEFYKKGALYASMTGSGSTVYGIFEKNTNPKPSVNPAWPIHIISAPLG